MQIKISSVINYLLIAVRIQLFLSLVSLPILVFWGLPISTLTVAGNLFFAPFLTIFLALSSIIFFLELAHVSNHVPIWLLEQLTSIWLKILPSNCQSYLLHFPKSSWACFGLGLITAVYILINQNHRLGKQTLILGVILLSSCGIAKLPFWIDTTFLELKHRKQKMQIYYHQDRTLTIHDYGTINHYTGTEGWILFHLVPSLIQKFGTIRVKQLYLHRLTKAGKQNLEILKENLAIEHIHCL